MENITAIKVSESEMEVTKEAVVLEPTKSIYSLDFLKNQELTILKSMNDFIVARQNELATVRALLAEAVTLGLKTQAEIQAEAIAAAESELEENIG